MSEVGSGRRLRRLVPEMIAIVVSILLAFSIDAAWEARSQRLREHQALSGLQADFLETQKEVQDFVDHGQRRITRLEALAAVATGRAPAPSRDSINFLLGEIIWFNKLDPTTSTLYALQGSGELGILRNERLRRLLATWETDLGDTKEDESLLMQSTFTDLWGWYRRGPPMANPFGVLPEAVLSQDSVDILPYLVTREFQNLVTQQYALQLVVNGNLAETDSLISEILDVVAAELEGAGR